MCACINLSDHDRELCQVKDGLAVANYNLNPA